MVKITFLGTGQAVPTARRNHSSILLEYKDENILVDCGEGTQRQFRKAKINPCKITKILITHWHGDHILGLPGLLQTLALNNYSKTLEVYGPKGTRYFLELMLKMFVFVGKLKVEIKEIDEGKFFENEDFYLESFRLEHTTKCLGYNFVIKEKLRIDKNKLKKLKIKEGKWLQDIKEGKDVVVEGKKIKSKDLTYSEEGKKISFAFDTRYFDFSKSIKNADLLVCESTYAEEEKEIAGEYGHMTSVQAAEIAKKAGVKKLILTHISQRYENSSKEIEKQAGKIFRNTKIAEDFDNFSID